MFYVRTTPGGRAGWEEDQKSRSSAIERQPVPQITEEAKTTEKTQSVPQITEGQTVTEKSDMNSVLKLSRANVPATIPLHQGYYNGEDVYFIITDSSDPTYAEIITDYAKLA